MINPANTPCFNVKKRPFSLMEVMICFMLILFCLIPLIYPNYALYKERIKFADTIKVDHTVTLLYGNLLEQLYRREIPYEQITQSGTSPLQINPEILSAQGINASTFPYDISLTSKNALRKGQKNGSYIAHLIEFTYSFQKKNSKEPPLTFTYLVPLVKLKPKSESSSEESPRHQEPTGPNKPARRTKNEN